MTVKTPSLLEGEQLGPYLLAEEIGRGGMGIVHRAKHVVLDQWVAVKLLSTELVRDVALLNRFYREVRSVGALDHPHVVRARDAGQYGSTHLLVMDLVDGIDVGRLECWQRPMQIADACAIVRQAADGLQHVHERGLVHRDIKPSNLMFDRAGLVRILDLGLARVQWGDSETDLTSTGHVLGTADYLAPEQTVDSRTVDIRADLYSLGCTLFKLVTGRAPFESAEHKGFAGRVVAHCEHAPPRVRDLRPEAPRELDRIVARLLEKDPADRFATPEELSAALTPLAENADLAGLAAAIPVDADTPVVGELGGSTIVGTAADIPTEKWLPGVSSPRERRRPIGRLIGIGLVGLAVVAGISLWATGGFGFSIARVESPAGQPPASNAAPRTEPLGDRDTPAASPPTTPIDLDALPHGRRHDLLDSPPVRLAWPNPERGSWSEWKRDERSLLVDCRGGTALFALGRTASDAFEWHVRIHQTNWASGAGVFIGLRPGTDESGKSCLRGQFLEVVEDAGPTGYRIDRGVITVRELPGTDGELTVGRQTVCSQPVAGIGQEERLEIECEFGRIRKIAFSGVELNDLVSESAERALDGVGVHGRLGTSSVRCFAEFRRPEFLAR